jgi:DNA-directed RNA polymerase specialized sigma24 family protein
VTSGMTDSDLVERSLADAVVFAVIFDRHHSELSLRAPAGRARAAGDVAAETFVIAFARRAAWRADGEARGYGCTASRTICSETMLGASGGRCWRTRDTRLPAG